MQAIAFVTKEAHAFTDDFRVSAFKGHGMKARIITILILICGTTAGCNTTSTRDDSYSVVENCCNAGNSQSGYYYNGYQENGWRYCASKRVEYR